MQNLQIVISVLDEEERGGYVIDRVLKTHPGAEVAVIDDGNKDKTATIAQEKDVIVVSNTIRLRERFM